MVGGEGLKEWHRVENIKINNDYLIGKLESKTVFFY